MPQYTIEIKDSTGKVIYTTTLILYSTKVSGLVQLIDSAVEEASKWSD